MRFACLLLLPILAIGLAGCPETTSCAPGFMQVGDECVPIGNDAQVEDSGLDAGPACGGCSAPTPVCDSDSMSCVACLTDADCGDLRCDTQDDADATNNTCVACLDDSDCEVPTPNCGPDNVCFGCTTDADCTDPNAAACDTGTGQCVPCSDNAHCAGVPGAGICDMSAESGVCVECVEDTSCAQTCDLITKSCSDVAPRSVSTCGSCANDSQCTMSHRCVPMQHMGEDVGFYCLRQASTGCERPFFIPLTQVSISGATEETYCGLNETLTTCEAFRSLQSAATCPGGANEECPAGGLCRMVGLAPNRCTYPCVSPDECPSTGAASTCGDGGDGGEMFCGG